MIESNATWRALENVTARPPQGANLLVNAARNMFSGDYELNLPANDAQEGDDGHEELF